MIAMFFGPMRRPLFGAYHPAVGAGNLGVVVCNPWGREYLCAHQSVGLLGRELSAAGHHVLRFDYGGTGDSAGDATEESLQSWREDLDWAIDEIISLGDVRRVAVVGLRLGAIVAAAAAAERRDVDRLVLWEPVVDGKAYVEELLGEPRSAVPSTAFRQVEQEQGGAVVEIGGFPLTHVMRREIEDISSTHYDRSLPSTLLISVRAHEDSTRSLAAQLSARAVAFRSETTQDPIIWLESDDFGAGGVSNNAVQVIREWLQ